jgi:hypothetical protein
MGLCHMTKKSNGIVNGGNRSVGLKKGIMETGINRSIGTVDEGIEDAFGILEIWGFEYRSGFCWVWEKKESMKMNGESN